MAHFLDWLRFAVKAIHLRKENNSFFDADEIGDNLPAVFMKGI